MAAADLVSKPTMRVSMGTKMPPPPTPPTVPHADPRNPIIVANMILQLNFNSCNQEERAMKKAKYWQSHADTHSLDKQNMKAKKKKNSDNIE